MADFYSDFDREKLGGSSGRDASDHRSVFQIDRDRVIFSSAFRRLQSKTQVFQSGEYDFYRTRLTHSIEVARIARSIVEWLAGNDAVWPECSRAIDPDLIEAIGLAHDLGHPPFGHIGERKLNELMAAYGGFEGNAQTVRIVTELFYENPRSYSGMRPTRAFLDGVMKYKMLRSEHVPSPERPLPKNHFLYDEQAELRDFIFGGGSPSENPNAAKSLECQIMDWADDTAYSLHDIVDATRAGFISVARLERWAETQATEAMPEPYFGRLLELLKNGKLERTFSAKVGDFIRAVRVHRAETSLAAQTRRHAFAVAIDPEIIEECTLYKRVAFDLVFHSPAIEQIEFKSGYLLDRLFDALANHYLRAGKNLRLLPERTDAWLRDPELSEYNRARRLCDVIASLTDGQASRLYRRLFAPEPADFSELI